MNGIILINKEKNLTSRDVVNKVSKKLNIKKVGHAGTLDPLATGLLVIGVGKGTKIMELLTLDTKEYIATSKLGIKTDTLDITGNILDSNYNFNLEKEELEKTLKSFIKKYYQEVPLYSAVKIKGKKLYQYGRNKEEVELPKKEVEIFKIELLDYKKNQEFTFKVLVSKGCYIRSLIRDIGDVLNINMTMKDLVRTKSGKFKLEDSNKLDDDYKLIKIKDALDIKTIKIESPLLLKKIKNGNEIEIKDEDSDYILILDNEDKEIAIYKNVKFSKFCAFKVF